MITARLRRRLPHLVLDTAPVLLAAATVLGAIGESHPRQPANQIPHGHVAPWPAYLLVAFASLVLVGRRRWPVPVLALSLAAVLIYTSLGYENGAALLGPVFALYAVAVAVPLRHAVLIAAATFVLLAGFTAAFNPFGAFGGGFVLIPGVVAAALFAGIAVANRRAAVDAIRQRAELAELSREDEARRRVDAERLRIARDLHDVVAHTMATINVQAGVAAHVGKDLPEQTATALVAIRDASKNGLRELRAILTVLRQADESEPTSPTPGLADLNTLVGTASAAGLLTTVSVIGPARQLPTEIDLAAYRIVQESLTNAIRHAGPASATVRIDYRAAELHVEVCDTGQGVAADGSPNGTGHGLVGMTERATAVGGTLRAGPEPGGGFAVRAVLPAPAP